MSREEQMPDYLQKIVDSKKPKKRVECDRCHSAAAPHDCFCSRCRNEADQYDAKINELSDAETVEDLRNWIKEYVL